MTAISATATKPAILPFGSLAWFKRELAPTRLREIRTAIMVGGTVLCVIISMTLQVPYLDLTAYMVFFASKETKFLTTNPSDGNRPVSWNVVVTRFCDWPIRIPDGVCCLLLAVHRRKCSLT